MPLFLSKLLFFFLLFPPQLLSLFFPAGNWLPTLAQRKERERSKNNLHIHHHARWHGRRTRRRGKKGLTDPFSKAARSHYQTFFLTEKIDWCFLCSFKHMFVRNKMFVALSFFFKENVGFPMLNRGWKTTVWVVSPLLPADRMCVCVWERRQEKQDQKKRKEKEGKSRNSISRPPPPLFALSLSLSGLPFWAILIFESCGLQKNVHKICYSTLF